ncbi:alpha/beta hydrolase [Actinospica durhamensis]|uniref:Alpha/beta hydrolase n=1 Tax=Actinospica durhamensis TaxID=1508375 RepID=A0A941ES48_9ACTN|nr:alpha/beta hydrolase [Actinospica durhamensis]MBR7837032.1 alpha/beta hydrolase [Actinospica durhamensis]
MVRQAQATPPPHSDTRTYPQARPRPAAQPQPVGAVLDRTIPGPGGTTLAVRVYEPRTADPAASSPRSARRRPALVYFFGGGRPLGCLETGDGVCRALTNTAHCVTVSVRYRLAPQFPFQAAVRDCHAATRWVATHAAELGVDRARIAVGGDEAGGNLAAAVALLARETGPALCHQLLVCPNIAGEDHDPRQSGRAAAWHWQQYLAAPEDRGDPCTSPRNADSLADLPAATVITAELDPRRDEAEHYALMLLASGVPVEVRRFHGVPQGFFALPAVYPLARAALSYAAAGLATAFAPAGHQPSRR